ncbi:MAG TPA: Holliday junction branch migration protein RuvA [Candidatus Paceibacterota bacterium]|nr:Holliday junction branch migration protein RuvA [Candidatus Paceibacterota bacterium]
MIGSIKGIITQKSDKYVLVETSGVGYKITVSAETLSKIGKVGDEAFFWIHTHVREDALDLFGFIENEDLSFFEMLLNVPGIGPRSALAILGIASPDTLRKAIGSGDTNYLTKVSGIGRKTAEKIVLELRDKIGSAGENPSLQGELDVLEALKSLGYRENEAREALKKVSPDGDTNKKIKEALKILN